ncbi:MAG: FtsX-like permease family protein [Bacteroidetes bacterium]|jgi:putative ABC transport system permease protein|nr:FtsX-like permease family protein [Bacteroidota bacterium]
MLRNYLTIAARTLRRNAGYTAINVFGLAVGMAACLLIGLYVGHELSYDDFHAKADRIYVMGEDHSFWGRSVAMPYPLASTLETNLPVVQRAVRTVERGEIAVRRPDQSMKAERRLLLADAAFFRVFDFALVRGDRASVLDAPDAAVITQSMARDFFGTDDPMGQPLVVERSGSTHTLTVRGVVVDVPNHSTIQFDVVAPLRLLEADRRDPEDWGMRMFKTYALLDQPLPPDTLAAQAKRAVAARLSDADRRPPSFFSMPLPALYLSDQHSTDGFRGQPRYLYIFGSVALFILLIAAVNYVNLVTVQAQQRAKEVGVRKAMGAGRGQLARQFLSESVLVSGAALVLALGMAAPALPAFNGSFGTDLTLLGGDGGPLLAGLAVTVLGIGVLAGAYPAFVLSRFEPARVLRGASGTTTGGGGWLRRGLVVLQFAISAALIVGTIVVYQQLDYMQTKNLGFVGERVAVIDLSQGEMTARGEAMKQRLLQHPGVEQVSVASVTPARAGIRVGMSPESVSPEANTDLEVFSWTPIRTDSAFVETLGLRLVAGRSFGPRSGSGAEVLINESAARELGWTPDEAVGKPFRLEREGDGVVVGVVKNFHLTSLREGIMPVVITVGDQGDLRQAAVKLAADGIQAGMDHVRSTFDALAPEAVLEHQFLDDEFDAMYRSEERLSQIFTAFAGIAILIACLGLLGLAAYAAQRHTKEIGIRKALGASMANIIGLLSKEFAALVAIALVLGMPVAYWAMQRWLENFAFRTSMSGWTFVGTALVALAIAGGSVSVHAIRAARTDPATALRSE